MQKTFNFIDDFVKVKERCFFCQTPLRVILTNFIGVHKDGIPIINSHLNGNQFRFDISQTSATFEVKAKVVIDIETSALIFENVNFRTSTPALDQYVVKQVFEDLKPHVELYCSNKKCKTKYHLCSDVFKLARLSSVDAWMVKPFKLFLESFRSDNLNVQNDWLRKVTNIYSLKNTEADPIVVPIIDFEDMGKDKLLTRIKTIAVFS